MSVSRPFIALIVSAILTMGWIATRTYAASYKSSVIAVPGANVYVSDEIGACLSATGNTKACNAADLAAKNVDSQDDIWRNAITSTTSCVAADFATGSVEASSNGGARVFNVGGIEVQAQMYDRDGSGGLLNATIRNSGAQTTGAGNTDMQDDAPKPVALQAEPYFNNNSNGASTTANAMLFTFNQPLKAFGAWFGDLETKLSLTDGRQWIAASSTAADAGTGGARASLRLIFDTDASGTISAGDTTQDVSIPETLAPTGDLWSGATAGTAAARLAAPAHIGGGGDPRFCGGGATGSDAVGCGNSTTRWIGFVADSPNVIGMLLTVGDDDHLLAGPQTDNSADQVASCVGAGGASDGDCDGGTERLSMIGATTLIGSCAVPTATPTETNTPTATFTSTPTNTLRPTSTNTATGPSKSDPTNTPQQVAALPTATALRSIVVTHESILESSTATPVVETTASALPTEPIVFAVLGATVPAITPHTPQLDVALRTSDDLVVAGQEVVLRIQVTNNGPDLANNVAGLLPLPIGLQYVSTHAGQGVANYSPTAHGVAYQLGTLSSGQSVYIDVTVWVTDAAHLENKVMLQAHASALQTASAYSDWVGLTPLQAVIPATGLDNPKRPSDWLTWVLWSTVSLGILLVRRKRQQTKVKH